jgi:hypothetical protein
MGSSSDACKVSRQCVDLLSKNAMKNFLRSAKKVVDAKSRFSVVSSFG